MPESAGGLRDSFAVMADPMSADEVFRSIISPIIQSFWPWNPFSSFAVTSLGTGYSLAIAGSSSGPARLLLTYC
jgi:hypothetical protein